MNFPSADQLEADYIVEGSIRRGGDTVRVTAQLFYGIDPVQRHKPK